MIIWVSRNINYSLQGRNAIRNTNQKWGGGVIPYVISSAFSKLISISANYSAVLRMA